MQGTLAPMYHKCRKTARDPRPGKLFRNRRFFASDREPASADFMAAPHAASPNAAPRIIFWYAASIPGSSTDP
jgi:hypothetical protein